MTSSTMAMVLLGHSDFCLTKAVSGRVNAGDQPTIGWEEGEAELNPLIININAASGLLCIVSYYYHYMSLGTKP